MPGREDFSNEEWRQLQRFPILVAALISAVDYSKLSEAKEFNAFASFIRKAGAKRKRSPFIAALLEDTDELHLDEFKEHCNHVAAALSGDKPVEAALKRGKAIGKLVDERLPKKIAHSYKGFIIDVAVAVARAHKESLVPFASPISKIEDFHIRRLEQSLGI